MSLYESALTTTTQLEYWILRVIFILKARYITQKYVKTRYLERGVQSCHTDQGCNNSHSYDYSPCSLKLGRNGAK